MIQCPNCSHRFDTDPHHPPTHCPNCQSRLRAERASDWTPIARLSNLADSGYFSDLIAAQEIDVQVKEVDEFNALLGLWEATFVLQVPRDDARRAAELMNQHLEASGDSQQDKRGSHDSFGQNTHETSETTSPGPHEVMWPEPSATAVTPIWKSVVLVLVAGGLAYGLGRTAGRRDVEAVPKADHDRLWQVLSRPGETWVNDSLPGRPKYRLHCEPGSDRIVLDEDMDGDGRYERRRQFERGRLVGDQ